MSYLYLVLSVFFISAGNVCGGYYTRKNGDKIAPTPLYNLLMIATVFLGWTIAFLFDFSFDAGVLAYAIPMGICFSLTVYANLEALKYGPVSLTSLFLQLSLIGVTIWGFFFWNAEVTALAVVGLILTVCSIVLSLYEKPDKSGGEKKGINAKWLIFAVIMLCGNATSSILQRTQQTKYDGKYGNELMVFAMGIGLIAFAVMYLAGDKTHSAVLLKQLGWLPVAHGITNFGLNLFVIWLATSEISPSLIYPVISVGGIAVGSLASVVLFKERLKPWQWVGIAVGAVAVVLLSV